jgi:hypothetical protein
VQYPSIILVLPEAIRINDAQQDVKAQVAHVVDDHASEEQEQEEPTKIQKSDAVVDPGAMVIMPRRVTEKQSIMN